MPGRSAFCAHWGIRTSVVVLSAAFWSALPAQAATITFEGLAHGEIVTNQLAASSGVTISAVNPNRPHDLGIIFNSLETGTSDPDLEGPSWDGGNLAPDTILGNLLIIAENDGDSNLDGLIDDPDDEGHRPAGMLIFDFGDAMTEFGLDLVDVESPTAELGKVEFFSGGSSIGEVGFDEFVDNTSVFYDPTVAFGNNSANRINPILASEIGATGFDRVIVHMGGSGAIDNINFVPEPTSMILLAGGALLAIRRRVGRKA